MTAKEAKKLSLKRASIQSRVDEVLINVKTATTYGYFLVLPIIIIFVQKFGLNWSV